MANKKKIKPTIPVPSCHSDSWDSIFGCLPVAEPYHADYSESYQVDTFHVFELADGKYATISESGCSCYDSSEAVIELHPTKYDACTQKGYVLMADTIGCQRIILNQAVSLLVTHHPEINGLVLMQAIEEVKKEMRL